MTAISGNKNLPALQAAAYDAVDAAAEATRKLFISPGGGQAVVYIQKQQEANAFLAQYPTQAAAPTGTNPTVWPFLSNEVGITGASMWAVATTISQVAAAWVPIAAQIESLRLGAKAAIRAATTPAAIATAQSITWPTPTTTQAQS